MRLELMAAVKAEFPHVLGHGIPPDTTAGTVTDVIVDLAVVDQRAGPAVLVALVTAEPGAILDRRFVC
jgi:hypothetical protein